MHNVYCPYLVPRDYYRFACMANDHAAENPPQGKLVEINCPSYFLIGTRVSMEVAF